MTALPVQYYQMLHELQAVDFVLVDLSLYLDTHDNDAQAYTQFVQFQRRRHNLVQQYEAAYGPLREFGGVSSGGTRYGWADGPWPWQV